MNLAADTTVGYISSFSYLSIRLLSIPRLILFCPAEWCGRSFFCTLANWNRLSVCCRSMDMKAIQLPVRTKSINKCLFLLLIYLISVNFRRRDNALLLNLLVELYMYIVYTYRIEIKIHSNENTISYILTNSIRNGYIIAKPYFTYNMTILHLSQLLLQLTAKLCLHCFTNIFDYISCWHAINVPCQRFLIHRRRLLLFYTVFVIVYIRYHYLINVYTY